MLVDNDPDTGVLDAYCSGVWINDEQILTAYHCVQSDTVEAGKEVGGSIKVSYYQDYLEIDNAMAVIKEAHYGVVIKIAPEKDLALIKINNPYHTHEIAPLSQNPINDGDTVLVVGHPLGLYYTWLLGTVARTRVMPNPHDHLIKVLHLTSSAWFGNSGGGAFDADGKLIGICSFLMRGPQMTFFVHRDEIAKFLVEQ